MARRDYEGNSVSTTITAQVNPADLSISIASSAGWPSGGVNGEFFVTVNRDKANEERILVASRSGTTLTIASVGKRAQDGTSAGTHLLASTIDHTYSGIDADEANRHINDPAQAVTEHSTLLDATRHAAISHTAAMIGTDSITADELAPNAVTSTELANDAVDTAAIQNLAVTGAKMANDTVTATQIAANAITASELADNAVDTAAIAALAVVASKIAADTITANEIAPLAIGSSELGAASVIAGKIAAGGVSATNQVAAGIIALASLLLEDPISYAPTFANFSDSAGGAFTGGTGGTTYGYYFKAGRLVVFLTGFSMAGDGNIPSGSTVRIPAPFTQKALGTLRGFVAARARRASPESYASGTGVIQAGNTFGENIATAGASAQWDATVPWNWGTPGDASNATLDAVGIMVSTT